MKEIKRKSIKQVEVEEILYIASDGKEFKREDECKDHERTLLVQEATRSLRLKTGNTNDILGFNTNLRYFIFTYRIDKDDLCKETLNILGRSYIRQDKDNNISTVSRLNIDPSSVDALGDLIEKYKFKDREQYLFIMEDTYYSQEYDDYTFSYHIDAKSEIENKVGIFLKQLLEKFE